MNRLHSAAPTRVAGNTHRFRGWHFPWYTFWGYWRVWGAVFPAAAMLRVRDVFLGFDSLVPDASWFPVVCEIKNHGPAFTGMVEVSAGQFNDGNRGAWT